MKKIINYNILYKDDKTDISTKIDIIKEEPLSIHVCGKPYAVIMRTPGDEIAHAAGFCLGEGIVDSSDDIQSISFCDSTDNNVIAVTLIAQRRDKISQILDRQDFISSGFCGKEFANEICQTISPVIDKTAINYETALNSIEKLSQNQPLRQKTKSSHAAMLFSADEKILSVAEDAGRHNALDKAVGKLFLEKSLSNAAYLVLSSRISYDLVQKAARACLGLILAISRPTYKAIELALKLNITLACLAPENGLYIFCNQYRIR